MNPSKRTKRPGPPKKLRPQRDAQGRFAPKAGRDVVGTWMSPEALIKQLDALRDKSITNSIQGLYAVDLDKLAAEFDREFPEMKSNRSEVGIVVTLVVLAAVAAALFFGLN